MAGATEELTPLVNQGDGRYTAEYKPKAIGQVSLKAVDAKTQKSSSAELIVFNTPPILSFEPVEFDKLGQVHLIDAGQTLNLSVKALDPDGDKVSLSASILANANFEPSSGKFSYTPTQPPKTEAIFQTVSFSADDGHEGKVSRSLSFQINAKPEFLLIDTQSPSIDPEKAISFSIEENQELSMSIVAKDLNLEQKLSYSAEGLPLALGAKIAKVGSNSGNAKNIVKFDGSRYRFDFTAGIRVGVGKVLSLPYRPVVKVRQTLVKVIEKR